MKIMLVEKEVDGNSISGEEIDGVKIFFSGVRR